MLNKIEKTVADFIFENHLLAADENILLAVSGGADSVCLLYVLHKLKSKGLLKNNFHVAHINHNLRGTDAYKDQQYVKELCSKLDLPFHLASVDVKGYAKKNALSEETAARDLRQQKLSEIAKSNNCSKIATAHHMDDNAETMIHRLSRGTGFTGIAGIWPLKHFANFQTTYIRPLLCIKRNEIIEYLESNNVHWQHDYTNDSVKYTRNKIRHITLPLLQQHSQTDLVKKLWQLSTSSQKLEQTITTKIDKLKTNLTLKENTVSINLELLNKQPEILKFPLIRKMLAQIDFSFQKLTNTHAANIMELCKTEKKSSSVELPLEFIALNQYGKLYIIKKLTQQEATPKVKLNIPGTNQFEGWTITTEIKNAKDIDLKSFIKNKSPFTEMFDMDKIESDIFARKRNPADRFHPLGLNASKKVGRFLIDSQIPQISRQRVILFEDNKKIFWVAPLRPSDTTKVNSNTTRVLKISVSGPNSDFF